MIVEVIKNRGGVFMNDISSIGDRLRQVRGERGLSRDQLAERAGMSARYIAKIEQGQALPSTPAIFSLASALGVNLSRLLDKRDHLEQTGPDRGILAIRDAILTSGDLPGLEDDGDGAPVPLAALELDVARGWQMYWQGRFGDLAALLPPLIAAAMATERQDGAAACRPLAQAYQLTADLLVHVGSDDLAYAVARRAMRAADRGGDPLQYASMAGTLSWASLHGGRLGDAERIARVAAENIRPAGRVSMAQLNVHGALLLSAAAPAAAAMNADAVADYMAEASVVALQFTAGDRHDFNCSFGPTQLAMQQAHTLAVLGHPSQALKAAKRVNRADLLHISWGAHQLDRAQAHVAMGKVAGAVDALWEAMGVSAEWSRNQGPFRDLVRWAVRKEARLSERTRKLRDAAGMR